MSDDKNVRHRFTVPVADDKVGRWIDEQSNLGFSLRVLIKAFVNEYGYQDATCLEFGTKAKKLGRPPKQMKTYMDSDVSDDDTDVQPDSGGKIDQSKAQQAVPKIISKPPADTPATSADDEGFFDPDDVMN